MNLPQLVDRIETLLGPAATPQRVEELADVVIRAARGKFVSGAEEATAPAVAAVRLGVPLQHCASRLPQTVRAHAYDTLRRLAAPFRDVANAMMPGAIARQTALHAVLSPVSLFSSALAPGDILELALTLEQAADHAGLNRIYGFSSFISTADPSAPCSLLESLPRLLDQTERLYASVDVGTSLHPEVLGRLIALLVAIRSRRVGSQLQRLQITVHAGPDRPLGGAFLPVTIRHPVIGLQLSSQGIINSALGVVAADSGLDEVQRAVRREAFQQGLAASSIGAELAAQLASRLNQRVLMGSLLGTALSGTGGSLDAALSSGTCACSPEDRVLEKAVAEGLALAAPGGGTNSKGAFRTISLADVASDKELEDRLMPPLRDLMERDAPGAIRFYS